VDRLLVIWCPDLLDVHEDGRSARAFARVLGVAAAFSPAVEAVRPGVCAVPTKGPSRYFGGDDHLARRLRSDLAPAPGAWGIGVADGLFAAVLAAQAGREEPLVVAPGASRAFLGPWPVDTLERPELADLLHRLGIHTLGQFAALPTRHVLGRLGTDGAHCHEVARAEESELPGWRPHPVGTSSSEAAEAVRQPGFWGGTGGAERRAEQAMARVATLLHPEAVVVGRLQGGRGPGERARLVPWSGRHLDKSPHATAPWPGRVPSPAPMVVMATALPAALEDVAGEGIGVTGAGMASAAPSRLSVDGGPWATVAAWAGPWPADERWWTGRGRRRRARMQLVTETGDAYLLACERGRWWVEGAYD